MGWDGIEECVAVATSGTFAGAAAALGVSTSHVSRAVARLERRLQTTLFVRTTRRVVITEAGISLVPRLRALVEERDAAIAEASSGGDPSGELRITCSVALGERFIAPLAHRFADEHAGLSVSLELSNRVVDIVEEGYDLAIRTGLLADSTLVATRIGARRLSVCAAPSYIDAHGAPESIQDLGRHECLKGTAPNWHFTESGRSMKFTPRGRWRCNSGTAVATAALAGHGICQLPDFYINAHVRAGRLIEILKHLRPPAEPIWAVYPQRKFLLPRVRYFVDMLKSSLPADLAAANPEPA